MEFWRTKAQASTPYVITFLLPLGFLGTIGVIGLALYAVLNHKIIVNQGLRPMAAVIPLGVATVAAALFGVDPASNLLHAIGVAALLTIGLVSARALVRQAHEVKLLSSFVLGAAVLAVSVILDFAFGINALPSGLFLDPSLHNWAGTVFAMALPAALHLSRQRSFFRVIGAYGALSVAVGIVAAFSWVGVLGAATGAFAYLALSSASIVLKARVSMAAFLSVLMVIALLVGPGRGIEVRGYDLARLQAVFAERLTINRSALDLALRRPLLGWGAFPTARTGIADAIDEVESAIASLESVRPPNLIVASEAFDAPVWRSRGAVVTPDEETSPIGTPSADLVRSAGASGARVYQYVRRANRSTLTYTFSLWLRSASGRPTSAALSITSIDEERGVLLTPRGIPGESVADRAMRFQVGGDWQRYSVNAEFAGPPTNGVVVFLFIDGYFNSEAVVAEGLYVWGAQLTEGPHEYTYVSKPARSSVVDLRSLGHFHSYYAQTAFESGLLGFAGLAVMLGALGGAASRSPRRDVALAALSAFTTTQAFDLAVTQASILLSFFILSSAGMSCSLTGTSPTLRSSYDRQPKS